jgi:hypothetical protein
MEKVIVYGVSLRLSTSPYITLILRGRQSLKSVCPESVGWHIDITRAYYPNDSDEKPIELGNRYGMTKFDVWLQDNSPLQFRMQWWDAIEDYTSRSLTNPSDKLLAIAGLSVRFQAQLDDISQDPSNYIAGLWDGAHLPSSLLWYVAGRQARPKGNIGRGPSFSWSSVDGSIRNSSHFASIWTCGLEILSTASTSNLISLKPDVANIHVKGKVAPAGWVKEPHSKRYMLATSTIP